MWKLLIGLLFCIAKLNAQQIIYISPYTYDNEIDSVGEWQMTLYNYAVRTLVYKSNNHFAEWLPAEPENTIIKYRLLYKCDSSIDMNFKIFVSVKIPLIKSSGQKIQLQRDLSRWHKKE